MEEVLKIKKDVSKVSSSFMQARAHRNNQQSLTRHEGIETGLLKDHEETLDCVLASVKKELVDVKVQN